MGWLIGVEMNGLDLDLLPNRVITVSKGLDGNMADKGQGTRLMFDLTFSTKLSWPRLYLNNHLTLHQTFGFGLIAIF